VATCPRSRGGGSELLWLPLSLVVSRVLPVGLLTDCGVTSERTHYAAPWTLAKAACISWGSEVEILSRSPSTTWADATRFIVPETTYCGASIPGCLFNSIQPPTDRLCMLYLLLINATYMACLYTRTLHCNYSNASGNTISAKLSAHLVLQLGILVSYNIYSSLNLLQLTDAPGSRSPYPETQRQASGSDLAGLG
jgi:hypothetical protein